MLKRTCKPFYTKDASRLTTEASAAMRAGDREGATAILAEADEIAQHRRQLHEANAGRNRKRFPTNLVHGRTESAPHLVTRPDGRRFKQRWS